MESEQYDYKWLGYGLLITGPGGKSCFQQGDDAAREFDTMDVIKREDLRQAYLSEYDHVMK